MTAPLKAAAAASVTIYVYVWNKTISQPISFAVLFKVVVPYPNTTVAVVVVIVAPAY